MKKDIKIFNQNFKILLLIVSLFSVLAISGCKNNSEIKHDSSENLPEIVVGCDDYSPFSYADVSGNMVGIDVELAKEAFTRMGYSPKFIFINWADKKKLLEEGKIDCIWSSFTMTDREDEYKWAGPYMKSKQVIAVNEDSDIVTLQDLNEKVIAVQSTTKPEDIIRKHDGTLPELKDVITVQKKDLLFLLLSKGAVDAISAHDTTVDQFMTESGFKYRILEEPLQEVDLGVAFDKSDDRELDVMLTKTLNEMQREGVTEQIIGNYLSDVDRYLEEGTDGK